MTLSGILKRHFLSLAIVAFTGISANHSAAAVTVTDLSAYGAINTWGLAINNLGQVTGGAKTINDFVQPFIYSNGQLRILDTEHAGFGTAINDAGQVVGGIFANARGGIQAFVYDGKAFQTITPFDEKDGLANGINAQGQVVGRRETDKLWAAPFSYRAESGLTLLNGFQEYATANDINSSETVVGTFAAPNIGYHGFILSDGIVTDIGTFGGLFSEARAINEVGQITGVSYTQTSYARAYIYENGVMKNIGTLGVSSSGFDINVAGDVVGTYNDAEFNYRAFLYTQAWGMVDLNSFLAPDSGWILQKAWGINDGRTIVGIGTLHGEEKVFMMSGELAVPEPSVALLILAGSIVIAAQSRRRSK